MLVTALSRQGFKCIYFPLPRWDRQLLCLGIKPQALQCLWHALCFGSIQEWLYETPCSMSFYEIFIEVTVF